MLGNPERPVGGLAVRTPPGVELVPLGRDDLADAVRLAREARGLRPPVDLDAVRDRWEALVNSPDTVAYLARDAGEPTGLAIMELRRRLNFATFEGWISDLRLPDGGAGRALGETLAQALVAEWRLRGGHRVLASVPAGDDARRAALESAGFGEAFIDFRLSPVTVAEGPMPPAASIRPLAEGDADAVTRLIAEFGSRRSPVPDRMEAVLRTYAAHARDVTAGHAASTVAELQGVTVGVCTLVWQRPFWTDQLHGWIPDLVVTEPVRGRGIGRALLASALRAARDAGAAEVRLESGAQRAAAHGLYRSTGFVETGHTWALRRED
jgi:ribosomal protein S18 acetylase RimI-like enzyme